MAKFSLSFLRRISPIKGPRIEGANGKLAVPGKTANLKNLLKAGDFTNIANNYIAQVKFARQDLGKPSYLSMVPEEHADTLAYLVKESYKEMGQGIPWVDFAEEMALNWLAKREAFQGIAEEYGFDIVEEGRTVDRSFNGGILALTKNGSIVIVYPSGGNAHRDVQYLRIPIREGNCSGFKMLLLITHHLSQGEAFKGELISGKKWNSSKLLAIAAMKDAAEEMDADHSMMRVFNEINKSVRSERG